MSPPPEYLHPLYRPLSVTRLSNADAAAALLTAIVQVTGVVPGAEALAIIVGHSALETGNFGRGFKNWNWGNTKSSLEWPHTYFETGEDVNGRTVKFFPPHVSRDPEHIRQTRFRAFDTAAQGAEHHLRLLTGGRYRAAYARALQGDIVGFCALLYRPPGLNFGYYTGFTSRDADGNIIRTPVQNYTDGLERRMVEIDARALAEVALESREYAIHLDEEIARRWPTKT